MDKKTAMTMNPTTINSTFGLICKKSFSENPDSFTPLCRALYKKKFALAISLIKNGIDINQPSKIMVNSRSTPCEFCEITPLEISLFRLKKIKNKIIVLESVQIVCNNIIEISNNKDSAISKAEKKEAIGFYESLPEKIKKYENLIKEVEKCIVLLKDSSIQR